ncbi:hypothetical protein LSUE1_G003452 [Lachnellula suecica]|uniref:PH domain-containing protein n=1 Tax=Lachnellula suecica TaxID=602035 RepID=A0A8T9CF31_9HELO|nr:hypothetical protein LSUE1_G003452 [Lachnellula suecica]
MIIFHESFLAAKYRCPLTTGIDPHDFHVKGEETLFRAQILDDGFEHSLVVHQDQHSGVIRLLAAVWNGELRRCPVWTAFGLSSEYML